MYQIKNIWLNEYDTLSMWKAGDTYIVRLEWSELREGGSTIIRRTLYKGKDEQVANTIFDTKVSEWDVQPV